MMDRRAALARIAALTGSAVVGAEFFLAGCRRADKSVVAVFSSADLALMDEIGETIIPTTETPGAKAIGIGAFMAMMVKDCYSDVTQAAFQRGLAAVDRASHARFGRSFVAANADQRTAVLTAAHEEQKAALLAKAPAFPPHYFQLMKELTLLGYFSSEIGCTHALRYVESPASYDGDLPYHRGDRAWFNPSRRFNDRR